ncbi:MAG: polyphosphate kinase 2 family protein [Acidobacteriota bacterium]|nr:polyphosphate kinase 2 family protein [Acidobacteriota bacterium]
MPHAFSFAEPLRVDRGRHFRLSAVHPGHTGGIGSKDEAERLLGHGIARLRDMQEKLYAQNEWSVLLILQAMDTAGKDGVIKHVMSGVNPQGCQVFSFKAPSTEELDHDFLWRTTRCLPERGRIGIFNRSYYEEVLVVRVHPDILETQHLPRAVRGRHFWQGRFESIRAFEQHLARNGTAICKVFLHISKQEQRRRLLSRLDEPGKSWKFSTGDLHEREYWRQYMHAYEAMVRETAVPHAPWHVIPADNKWFARLAVAAAMVDTLERLDLSLPKANARRRKELRAARRYLEHRGH